MMILSIANIYRMDLFYFEFLNFYAILFVYTRLYGMFEQLEFEDNKIFQIHTNGYSFIYRSFFPTYVISHYFENF